MAEAIRMPLLSDTMKEGKIIAWHKKVGDTVKSDDVIAEVETDKATMEVLPYVDGTLLYIGTEAGTAARVNDIIAIVGKQGEDYKSLLDVQPTAEKETAPSAPQQETKAEEKTAAAPQQQAAAAPDAAAPAGTTVVRMPLLSDTMKEGKIVAWHKKVGDTVKSDDVMAEVETDKATMEVMPYADGTLLFVGVEEGKAAAVNDIIAIVGKAGTDVSAFVAASKGSNAREVTPSPEAKPDQQPAQQKQQEQPAPQQQHNNSDEHGRIKISPLARRLAEEKGIDVHELQGSGDNGRIVKRDVDNYKAEPQRQQQAAPVAKQQASASPTSAQSFTTAGTDKDTPLSQMRRVIAQRLSESKQNAPHFYLRMTVTMDNAAASRKAMNEQSPVKISFNDLIIKACAMALRKHPEVNSSWMGDFIRQNAAINVGMAVAIEDGLIVPVIKNADQKPLSTIAEESNQLVEKARNKKLQPLEFSGNTFTISNLGMMDIDEFTAIINPPDACILAVGKIAPTPVVENGQVVVRQLLKLTLSCDHRVVDGAVGARFLQTLKTYLEHPAMMLV